MGVNEISYNIFSLRHIRKLAPDFQKKNKNVYTFTQVSKQRKWENIKNWGEPYSEPCQISVMEHLCENTMAKSFVIDVWYGCKYTPEVV